MEKWRLKLTSDKVVVEVEAELGKTKSHLVSFSSGPTLPYTTMYKLIQPRTTLLDNVQPC